MRIALPRGAAGALILLPLWLAAACSGGDGTDGREAALASYERGVEEMRSGAIETALKHFAEATRLDPNDARWRRAHGAVLERLERLEDARLAYLEAQRLEPASEDARLHIARVESLLDLDPRIAAASAALPAAADRVRAHVALGDLLRLRGRRGAAKRHYTAALRLAPDDARAHAGLGAAHVSDPAWEATGLHHLARALEIDPSLTEAVAEIAWVQATSGDPTIADPEAAAHSIGALSQAEGTAQARLLDALAATQARAGRYEAAVETARRAEAAAFANDQHLLFAAIRNRAQRYANGQPWPPSP